MKKNTYNTNRPLFLGICANAIYLTMNQLDFFNTNNVCHMFKGALAGFAIVAMLIGVYNNCHETSISQLKKNFIAGLLKK